MIQTLFFFFLALFILVVSHEAGHFCVARMLKVRVLRFSFGFGKVLFRFMDKKHTEYTWSLIPLGGYVKMLDEQVATVPTEALPYAFNRKPLWVKFLIVLAGPVSNLLLAWVLLALVLMIGLEVPGVSPMVADVGLGTPAHRAGLMPGDIIQRINDRSVSQGQEIATYVQDHPDETIQLTILRQKQTFHLPVKLTHNEHKGHHQGLLGIQLKTALTQAHTLYRESFFRAIILAGEKTWALTTGAFVFVGQLIQGHLPLAEVSGPVGIAKLAGESVAQGLTHYLLFMALVSVSLGVLNLLPIPLLDGGHLAYYLIEFVMRRPLSQRTQMCAAYLGFGVIFLITFIAFKNDLARLGW